MTNLAERQSQFMAAILDERAPLPDGWGNSQTAGMHVYRGNYRSAVMGALKDTYDKTARYVGEDAFRQVATHHVIAKPSASWTIDDAGAGFDATCAELFGENPEVADIAWLEWSMLQAGRARDVIPLDGAGFAAATASFGEAEWTGLRLEFQPMAAARQVRANLTAIWKADGEGMPNPVLSQEQGCLVWREGERSTFTLVSAEETRAFVAMQDGASYGEVCIQLAGDGADSARIEDAAMRAGEILGHWLNEGMIVSLGA